MSAWLLPDYVADVLPAEARHLEALRRQMLDLADRHGYELVMPPLVEHLDSLLVGAGDALDLQTFKLVDQLSGRTLGLRADTTPQVARIDAHLLGREGVTRLAYCGPVVHTLPDGPHGSREPLQMGAELYGHAGLEAELEVIRLALDAVAAVRVTAPVLDLAEVRIVRALMGGVLADLQRLRDVYRALAAKDSAALRELTRDFPAVAREGLLALPQLYGDLSVLDEAERVLPALPAVHKALASLRWLAERLEGVRIGIDLSDLGDYAYYSGVRFALYHPSASDAVVRGGRYDGMGAVFGHPHGDERAAVGFSVDLKALARVAEPPPSRAAIRAPWADAPALWQAVRALRDAGETVIGELPGTPFDAAGPACDRMLVEQGGQWVVKPLA